MAHALLILLVLRLVPSPAARVHLDPNQSDASAQRFQNALDTASSGSTIELFMASAGHIAIQHGPLRANRSVTIVADPASPFPPSFDCLGRSGLLLSNASHDAASTVSISGMHVRNGRSELGGSLHLLAGTVRLHDVTISRSAATMEPDADHPCQYWPPSGVCLRGGGAVFVQATSLSMVGVDIRNASTPLSGGAIGILDARYVHLRDIVVHDAQAGSLGGAIAVSSSTRSPHQGFNWTISNVTATGTTARSAGGGVVALYAHGDVVNSTWAVTHVTATNTRGGFFGGVVFLGAAMDVSRSTWSVACVTATRANGGQYGGAVSLYARSDAASTWSVEHVTATGTTADFSGGAISLGAVTHVSNCTWLVDDVTATRTVAGYYGGAVAFYVHHDVSDCTWSVAHVTAMDTEAGAYGGAVALEAVCDVSRSSWSVAHVAATNTKTGGYGGAVYFFGRSDVSSTWLVEHVTATGATAGSSGGAVFLGVVNHVSNCTWLVDDVTATSTFAGYYGGAVAFYVHHDVSDCTWSVAHVTATNTVAGYFGGAVALEAADEVARSTWSVVHVTATGTRGGEYGGAVSLYARSDELSTWSVRHVTATGAAAGSYGGAVYLGVVDYVSSSTWSVAHVTAASTTAGQFGGAVALDVQSGVRDSAWSVTHVTATDISADSSGNGGGAVFLGTSSDVSRSTWSVAHITTRNVTAGANGGAVFLKASTNVSSTAWCVGNVTATRTTAGGNGGAVALLASKDMTNSTWSVSRVTAVDVKAGGYGGAVALIALSAASGTINVTDLHAAGSTAKRGGVIAIQITKSLGLMCSLFSLRMAASRATAEGGGMYVSVQSAERTKLFLLNWHATDLSALEGAVGVVSQADAASGPRDGLDVVARQFRAVRARAKQSSGVLAVHAGRPHQISWRSCDEHQSCPFTPFMSSEIPVVYAVQVIASEWDVADVSATTGALAGLDNVNASFSNLLVRSVDATVSGGLWSLSQYTSLSVHNMSATIARASARAQGLLLDQGDSPGNLSLSNVTARLEGGPLLDSGDQTWINAGALTPTSLSGVAINCPVGATFHNVSLGRVHLTQSPFHMVKDTFVPGAGFVGRPIATAQAFPYSATTLGCRVCAEGKYMLARLAWVSSDAAGAACATGLDANVTMPLCPNAPLSKSSCLECPTGATCHGGAHVTAQVGRWGLMAPDHADQLIGVFPLLQFGYACSLSSCQQRFDSCAGNRTGFACGRCGSGFGEVIGSVECVADAACREWEHYTAWVAFPLGCIAAAAFFLYFADTTSDGVSSGLATILFVLFQSEAIIRTHDESKASALSHWSMFQISLPAARVCLWPGMSARAKALVPLGTYGAVLAALGLFYASHWLLYRLSRAAHPPSVRRYRRALVSLLLVSYGAIANVCLKLVTRTEIDGAWYQSLTGERWMHTPDQWIALAWLVTSTVPTPLWFWYGLAHLRVGTMSDATFGLGLLFPIPAALWPWLMRRWPVAWDEKQAARDLHHTLAAPYSDRFWYWDGVFLAQRLVLGLISVSLASDLVYRAFAMAVIAMTLALVYTYLHVFSVTEVTKVHMIALLGLQVVCFSNGIAAYTYQHGYEATPDLLAMHIVSTWSLRAVPVVAIAVMLLHRRKETGAKNGRCGGWRMRWEPHCGRRRMDPGLSATLIECSEQQDYGDAQDEGQTRGSGKRSTGRGKR